MSKVKPKKGILHPLKICYTLSSGFVEPVLKTFNSPIQDVTYGRELIPISPAEQILRSEPYVHSEYKIPFQFNGKTNKLIYYQTWSLPTAKVIRDVDIVFIHGLNDYGGRFSEICSPILEQGFRIIAPDLPGFGRSSGLHAYFDDTQELIDAVHLVINHVKEQNARENKNPKTILLGESLGGMIVLTYAIKHPETFDAFNVLCPLVYVSPESRPGKIAEMTAKALVKTPLGRLPLVAAHRGKFSSDPKVEQEFLDDPMTYSGNLRCATGLALSSNIEWLGSNLKEIKKPFLAQHGLNDRATDCNGSRDLYNKVQTPEDQKSIILYENCEHLMLRDPVAADKVIKDSIDWFISMEKKLKS
ncbi:4299_t:CDS:2 [Scutellospora calospora]|uniref:4299_t:CDS:1 n=1 Tax=Scutellospora calospora TaxID=85575 RepID=A0ACA9K4Z1_9GLOM|nr:4299_t:CDS:2 [Scutellospora calospora]